MNLRRTVLAFLTCAGIAAAQQVSSVSAGNWGPIIAPDSIAAGFGAALSSQTYTASSVPLPTSLGNASLSITDSAKATGTAGLYMVSTGQVNFLVPATAAVGAGSLTFTTSGGTKDTGTALISNVAPAIFAANMNGMGVAAAQFLRITPNNTSTFTVTFAGASGTYLTSPYSLAPATDSVYLILYATGIRRHSLNPVEATIAGAKVPVLYAGPVASDAGLDQINIGPLPSSLAGSGKGDVPVQITVDGAPANAVTINIQ